MTSNNRPRVPIDKSQWSEKAKRSLGYEFAGVHYKDQRFKCCRCRRDAVFTAEQQKHDFEVKKAHIDRQHVLCNDCFLSRCQLVAENNAFIECWKNAKEALKRDTGALRRWLTVLEVLPAYAERKDTARIRMLQKLISGAG